MIGKAHNADSHELAFEGFEDYDGNNYSGTQINAPGTGHGHGHLKLMLGGSTAIGALTTAVAHTGKVSVVVSNTNLTYTFNPSATGNQSYFMPHFSASATAPRKYVVSAWFKPETFNNYPTISVNGATLTSASAPANNPVIEGWQKWELVFTMPTSSYTGNITISLGFAPNLDDGTSYGYIDDIRIIPFQSVATTYVYDPVTLWLKAELDNNHYATFYNYDGEGNMTQVKKETVKGIVTIKANRTNTHK